MAEFDAIDALLAGAGQEVRLPPAQERRRLREGLSLSRAQLAQALGVGASTVGGWEAGRDPSGEVREKYAYFLDGARTKLDAVAAVAAPADAPGPAAVGGLAEEDQAADTDNGDADTGVLSEPRPCVLCGQPARHQVEGFPQHLDPAECGTATPVPAQPEKPAPRPASRQPTREGEPGRAASGVKVVPVGRRVQAASDTPDLIGSAVAAALAEHAGDVEAATAALIKRAIPDAMALLDHTRKGGRYDVVAHPWLPDILRKQSARGADQVWEARPKWSRPELPAGEHEITALDINGAYLSALKTHLPLGQLEHSTGDHHDRRRAGLHLITPPVWDHGSYLPDPIGNRDEPGPLWVTEPTLRLLLRVAGPKYGLCDPPEIHESWTSGATEGLLEKFRIVLKDARDRAIAEGDEVTLEYVKAMYSKFVSTLGESNYNRELYRTDWMHLIRSQAFANLWWKAHRAYDEGLMVVRAMGTDELHVAGDWHAVFPEGRGVTEVKVKDVYTVGTDQDPALQRPESPS
ncbi:transcriptional regulator with XRE-family HTH domain [Streptomyces phaeochromogenes]|uniref:helix-turn-helix domain-containing protein n=1 Tax=Streptomyces phaeochromogenes TaxID=1923 RepID=UPI0027909AFB|nr:helix-turn-helix transcriptional regulator [Streptomyces phaeochromogenes]MDQ0946616.1 transcriptional regulator with XRE-family HTH domain [Streptomyces phaeochromogenes]